MSDKTKCATCELVKITRKFNFSFNGARVSLRLFVIKNERWEKNKKHRVGPDSHRDRLTRCPFIESFLCPWSPVKMVYFFLVFSRLFVVVGSSFTLATNAQIYAYCIAFYILYLTIQHASLFSFFSRVSNALVSSKAGAAKYYFKY